MPAETVKIGDVPICVFQEAGKLIENYSTALILEKEFIGSATFISWKNKFGILTAEHVTNNPRSSKLTCRFNANSEQVLQLLIALHPHALAFEMRHLQNITLGRRDSDRFGGPDVSVIVLPDGPQISLIKGMKSFWQLDGRKEEKIAEALDEGNFVVVAGCPAEKLTEIDTRFGKVPKICGIAAIPTERSKYFTEGNYDYLETSLGLGRATGSNAVVSYEGVSGGSLWRVKIGKHPSGNKIITRPYLAGVNFWQGDEIEGVRVIRSHGPKTIYESLLPKLLEI
ncbi:MAG TPA: hypothetical protein VN836_10435 [Verrucomicrobiae bacterium]|nr:hypothetical protein [Verrucomicrobiae bacterium]